MAKRLIRYLAVMIVLIYGFAKLNGSQFTILDSELDKPMGQVSGFWLTWYYFGFSPVYGTFLAAVQIAGALLLTFRRTTLLGACMVAPMLLNIILIDVCFGIDPGATFIAILLLLVMVSIIVPRRRELLGLFFPPSESSRSGVTARWTVRIVMVALAFGFTYWTANYNNRLPTPIDGAWDVVQTRPAGLENRLPSTIYFEHNRAYMAVFKTRDQASQTHHFELSPDGTGIGIWQTWLAKGVRVFEGRYTLHDSQLTLEGNWRELGALTLDMRRRTVRRP